MKYAVLNKATKTYFGGFDSAGDIIWISDIRCAMDMDRVAARGQAALLICHGLPVQRKPVAIPACVECGTA